MKSIFCGTFMGLLMTFSIGDASEFVLVVHPSNPVTSLSQQEVRNIFLGKKSTWEDGDPVTIIIQSNSETHESFTTKILNKSSQQFSTFWKKALFTGTGVLPRSLSSDAEVKQYIATNRGAIGYVSTSAIDKSVKKVEFY